MIGLGRGLGRRCSGSIASTLAFVFTRGKGVSAIFFAFALGFGLIDCALDLVGSSKSSSEVSSMTPSWTATGFFCVACVLRRVFALSAMVCDTISSLRAPLRMVVKSEIDDKALKCGRWFVVGAVR
jgi:hypothetical protein